MNPVHAGAARNVRLAIVEGMSASPRTQRLTTRVLLMCAALAGAHALLHFATLPLLTTLAPVAPPAYALVAGAHSVMAFLARRVTGAPGSAIVTSAIAALLVAPTSTSGLIAAAPVLLAGCVIDLALGFAPSRRRPTEQRYFVAGALTGLALFGISLAVFSPEHLSPPIIVGAGIGRLVGEALAVILSRLIARGLLRAGVGRALRPEDQSSPAS